MLREDSARNYASKKIITAEQAAKLIEELKRQGKKSGLCLGGFDLLHPGHIRHFESAKKLCDRLFVGVTCDEYVKSRKGAGRPIFSEVLRAYSVAAIEYVDYVLINRQERGTDAIRKLKPSYYIKGPDFAKKTTPGITAEREAVRSVGGEIKYTTDQKFSTTDLIDYIQKNVRREKLLLAIDRDGTLIECVHYLGKDKNWKSEVELKKNVADFIVYLQAKYDTVKVVVSNQQGIARNYFSEQTAEKVNEHVNNLLKEKGIAIDSWQHCGEVDRKYAEANKDIKFNPKFVKDKTKRKPNPVMLLDALRELGTDLRKFDKIAVLGDDEDDRGMAKKLNAKYIDVSRKSYEELKKSL